MTRFRPSPLFRAANLLLVPLIRLGLPLGLKRAPMALLTVSGRSSGLPRATPVALAERDGGWLLVAVFGVADWALNLEAAGRGEITVRRKTTPVVARRLKPSEAGPILRDAMVSAPGVIQRMTASYFTANHASEPASWEEEAMRHPVFELRSVR